MLGVLLSFASTGAVAMELADEHDVAHLCEHSVPVSDPLGVPLLDDECMARAAEPVPAPGEPNLASAEARELGVGCGGEAHDLRESGVASRDYSRRRNHLLVQAHEIVVGSQTFALLPYDPTLGVLGVPIDEGFTVVGGALTVHLLEGNVVLFELSADLAEEIVALHHMGSINLRVVFELTAIESPTTEICRARQDGGWDVDGRALSLELYEPSSGRVLARSTTRRHRAGQVRLGTEPRGQTQVGIPVASVSSLTQLSSDESEVDLSLVQLALESSLSVCYVSGMVDNSRLQGALVLGFDVDADGNVAGVDVLVDALDCATLRVCAVDVIYALRLPREAIDGASSLRATLMFEQRQ